MATIRKRETTKKSQRGRARKTVRWQAVVRRQNAPSQTKTFDTKEEAKAWAADIESAINRGAYLPNHEAKRRTVKDLLDRYKENEIPKKGDRVNPTRHANFWIERLGHYKLQTLSRALIVEVRDEIAQTKAASTVNRYLATLSHACTMAEREWEWLDSNPLRKVSRMPEGKGRVRYLSEKERERLLKACQKSDHPHLYAIVLIALTTGARRAEILNLMWRDVDLKSGRAVLNDTKNKERRSLVLVPPIIVELQRIQKSRKLDTDLIFTTTNSKSEVAGYHRAGYFYFEKDWREVRKRAKLVDFRFHDLRHSCASYLAMNGATTAEIAAVLGHKTLAMVKRYSHLSDEHVRGIVERTALSVLNYTKR